MKARTAGFGSQRARTATQRRASGGSPTVSNTAKVRWVVKNGEVYDAETMRELHPRDRPLPRFFWQTMQ